MIAITLAARSQWPQKNEANIRVERPLDALGVNGNEVGL